jgi:hypothetical protein
VYRTWKDILVTRGHFLHHVFQCSVINNTNMAAAILLKVCHEHFWKPWKKCIKFSTRLLTVVLKELISVFWRSNKHGWDWSERLSGHKHNRQSPTQEEFSVFWDVEINQLNALKLYTSLFSFTMAPTCFGKTMPSSGATIFLTEPLQRQYGRTHVTGHMTEPTSRSPI